MNTVIVPNTLQFETFFAASVILALALLLLIVIAQVTKEEYVDPPYVPRHLRTDGDILAELDFDVTVELTDAWHNPISLGRRAVGSPVRHVPVARDWMPYIGTSRIVAILETPTAEYLFARNPKDQLSTTRTQYVERVA